MTEPEVTTADVVEFARKMREGARKVTNPDVGNTEHDPWARPYSPSDDVAYKLCSQLGPVQAMLELRRRRDNADRAGLEVKREDDRRERRERRRREREDRDREAMRKDWSRGQRIDDTLAKISVLAEGDTLNPDGYSPKGAEHPSKMPRRRDDALGRATKTVDLAIRAIESDLDAVRRRSLRSVQTLDRDGRLRLLRGYSPEQVSIADREQGPPRMVRDRRRAMGLDELTGDDIGHGSGDAA